MVKAMWARSHIETSTALDTTTQLQELIDEMRLQDFDSIRFATYRAACKLRFVQKKTNVHLVDIWNMIESFRENGLNALPVNSQMKISRLELLLASIFHNLNKRLPTAQHIDTDKSISLLLSFIIGAYDKQQTGRLTVFSIKIALATICAGKLVDKLRYVFSQISDANGIMDQDKFSDYLQQVLALATAVFEGPTFGYSEITLQQCFLQKDEQKVTLNVFLDVLMSDPCPPCLMWLPLLHRMANVEHVYHPVTCDACQSRSFAGFRYKCQRCTNYQLCQQCFWRGRTSGTHSNEHEMKEYSSYKSPTKQLVHSIHKSLRCVPSVNRPSHPIFPEQPQHPLDLSNAVPITPTSMRYLTEQLTDWDNQLLPGHYTTNGTMLDDEHKLIARYSAKLSGRTQYPTNAKERSIMLDDNSQAERAMIARLEEENGEMLREMELIKQQQEMENTDGQLGELRERKAQLEEKMHVMQQTRRRLMQQLESIMMQLNRKGTVANGRNISMMPPESLSGIGSRVTTAFRERSIPYGGCIPSSQLQGDLLHAADDITSNMSNLLKELDQSNNVNEDINGGLE